MSEERLAELPEPAATGRIAELYADIRLVLGLPMVNLVYRHLATRPGVLDQCWPELRPNLASRAAAAAATELVSLAAPPGVAPIPRASLAVAGVTGEKASLVHATLAAYRRANSLNALGMCALLQGCPGECGSADAVEVVPPPLEPILPMAGLDDLSPPVAALLDEMSLRIVGGAEPRLVPSLFRHFAADECVLAIVWSVLKPLAGETARLGELVAGRAGALANALPRPVAPLEEDGERTVAWTFARATARMLVAGEILVAALADSKPNSARK